LRLTLRGLWSRKLRAALTFVVVMLGVSLMAGTLVLTDTIRETFNDLFADVNRAPTFTCVVSRSSSRASVTLSDRV
jgi:ABC-type antimicrobial peptide transport system permease subunit